jgi:hypothetical protein
MQTKKRKFFYVLLCFAFFLKTEINDATTAQAQGEEAQ